MTLVISMKKVELLAPAGSFEALEAAVMCGADAVYLGGTKFGARAYASNFDNENIIKAVNYAHLYGVKIYVTVNTLIYDDEVSSFLDYITYLDTIGVDAFIIQDLGMMHFLRSIYPHLELHASTQMHIHNIESILKLKELGVKRVVLPREFSLSKVKSLKEASGMDIEIFVHGALCISYSGQCLMSSLIGGRSGNRGECAGSCRLAYKLVEKDDNGEKFINTNGDYPLSTKDLNTLEHINEIIDSGVDSLKIEGRMKKPEYVAIVTTLYRRVIDSYYEGKKYQVTEDDLTDLKKMYNREFTKGYLFGDKGKLLMNPVRPNHMGTNLGRVINADSKFLTIKLNDYLSIGDGIRILSNDDIGFTVNKIYKNKEAVSIAYKGDIVSLDKNGNVNINDEVVKTTDIKLINNLNDLYKSNNRKIKITGELNAYIGKELCLTVSDGINNVSVKSDINVSSAQNRPVSKDIILEKLNKIGDTPYIFDNININMDNNIFVPLTEINAIKREAIDKLSELRIKRVSNDTKKEYNLNVLDVYQNEVLLKSKIKTIDQYQACIESGIDIIYVEDYNLYQSIKDDKRVTLGYSSVRKTKVIEDNALVGDIGAVNKNKITNYSLNVVNSYTVAFLHSLGSKTVTLSYEMDINKISSLIKRYKERYKKLPNLEVIVYGRIEAMVSEYCPLNTYICKNEICNICKNGKKYYLRDRFKNDYVLSFNNCIMTIYNYKKLNIIDNISKLIDFGINNFRLNFVDENYEDCLKIIKEVKSKIEL
jgi:putative protease